jgi:hypothetical protein
MFSVSPNPSSSEFNIETNLKGEFEYEVLDDKGTKQLSGNFIGRTLKIDIREMNKGIYYIRLISKDEVQIQRIIKSD